MADGPAWGLGKDIAPPDHAIFDLNVEQDLPVRIVGTLDPSEAKFPKPVPLSVSLVHKAPHVEPSDQWFSVELADRDSGANGFGARCQKYSALAGHWAATRRAVIEAGR